MADPLSITASAIGVITAAFQSCQALNGLVSSWANAPKTLKDLRGDLSALQNLIQSLQREVATSDDLSAEQRTCILELVPAIESCRDACEGFSARVSRATSHSKDDQVAFLDRARLYLGEKDIQTFKSRLGDCKQTLNVALGVVTLNTMSKTREQINEMETQTVMTLSSLTGKLQGIELALQAFQSTEVAIGSNDVTQVLQVLNDHDRMLRQCLKVCTSGLGETAKTTGTTVKYAETLDQARQFIGNIGDVGNGGPETNVEHGQAKNESRQVIGNIDASFARDYLC
ncbi:hypothetical protein PFICI_11712 [Pestalotiopsis fici W106-1]|uniref:Azaphilone pigments biosynthesis cluster protein L N-terminal domain-containing protein n=1 Tax=Pestalotiopsis fici (strain W106-1 / CGMCC3.15140) TaxID=1229662 RepID=W3WR35_PESFW|nr:uncharacterized protein PFICI_11712 [Pestalotiopsis fici W106-1]ETS76325.1 hypothetical protein PFICI_11712 [Pestalotiopsis fici W106-1]